MSITIIVGPMACGKTHNKEALKRAYGAKRIVDGFDAFRGKLRNGDIALCSEIPRGYKTTGKAKIVKWGDAAKKLGLPEMPSYALTGFAGHK